MMKRIAVIVLILLFVMIGCGQKDAFFTRSLVTDFTLEREKNNIIISGRTNLPDGFALFMQVDAAPELGAEASWSGPVTVIKGQVRFETLFTDPLPYQAKCIISAAINPEYKERFLSKDLPFAVDESWRIARLADGSFELQKDFSAVFGTPAQHEKILSTALAPLERAIDSLMNQTEVLDKMAPDYSYGLSRFSRLHYDKKRISRLDQETTSYYYPTVFHELEKADRKLEAYFRQVLASFEKDPREMKNNEGAGEKCRQQVEKVRQTLQVLRKKANSNQ